MENILEKVIGNGESGNNYDKSILLDICIQIFYYLPHHKNRAITIIEIRENIKSEKEYMVEDI